MDNESLLLPPEAARILKISDRAFAALMALGEIKVVRIGRSVRIRPSALREFVEARETRIKPLRRRVTKAPVAASKNADLGTGAVRAPAKAAKS